MEARLTRDEDALPAFARGSLWPWVGSAPFVAWGAWLLSRGEVRWEVVAIMLLVPVLAFATPSSRRLFTGLYPVALVALLYDGMRFVKNVGLSVERVHVCDLRALDAVLFGSSANGHLTTVHDWVQARPVLALDALFAIPYGTYIYTVIAMAVFLYSRDFVALQRFTWTFFLLNVVGFITYHILPAAPPWYFHAHGCAVDLAARASEGPNLARVDAMLGVRYFHGFYGRSNDVFGAVPSLHVAYPVLLAREGFPHLRTVPRVFVVAYASLMIVGAVYLDHHWIVDVLLGLVYVAVISTLVRRAFARMRTIDAPSRPADT